MNSVQYFSAIKLGYIYKRMLKPVLFKFDPEFVHDRFTNVGVLLGSNPITRGITSFYLKYSNKILEQEVLGIQFKNPVGLSAGFDKNAQLLKIIPSVGFGHMEVGSVTAESYEGNEKPRLKRLPKSKALVVYYGLKNIGVDKIIERLQKIRHTDFKYSVSIAKTNCLKTASEDAGIEDYAISLEKLSKANLGDFYTINISCPNTFGGEPFTTPKLLNKLLVRLDRVKHDKPVFIKMPINLEWKDFNDLLVVASKHNVQGVIIGNLTKARDPKLILDKLPEDQKGGISGLPTQNLCNDLIKKTYANYKDRFIIVGVGGIFSAEDAYEKIKLGASLLQMITGMIFEGPQVIGSINRGLAKLIAKDGYKNISEAIGSYHK